MKVLTGGFKNGTKRRSMVALLKCHRCKSERHTEEGAGQEAVVTTKCGKVTVEMMRYVLQLTTFERSEVKIRVSMIVLGYNTQLSAE